MKKKLVMGAVGILLAMGGLAVVSTPASATTWPFNSGGCTATLKTYSVWASSVSYNRSCGNMQVKHYYYNSAKPNWVGWTIYSDPDPYQTFDSNKDYLVKARYYLLIPAGGVYTEFDRYGY